MFGKPIWDDSDVICTECGSMLSSAQANAVGNSSFRPEATAGSINPQQTAPSNPSAIRYKSNDTSIAGNQINAQHVDNRTVTNITAMQDEGRKIVTCAISGEQLYRIDTIECPKCRRLISKRFYVFDKLSCTQCAQREEEELERRQRAKEQQREAQMRAEEEKRQNEERVRLAEEKARLAEEKVRQAERKTMPPIIDSGRVQETISAQRIETSSQQGGASSKKTLIYVLAAILVAAAVGGVMMMGGEDEKPLQPEQIAETVVEQKTVTTNEQEVVAPAPKPAEVAPAKQTSPKQSEKKQEPETQVKESPFDSGVKAYKAGEYSKAVIMLERALNSGKSAAAYYLADMYKKGNGVSRNGRKAFAYMKQAAEGGCTDAYYALAEMYRTGDGTEPNRSLAQKWYEEAAVSSGIGADKAVKVLERYR